MLFLHSCIAKIVFEIAENFVIVKLKQDRSNKMALMKNPKCFKCIKSKPDSVKWEGGLGYESLEAGCVYLLPEQVGKELQEFLIEVRP